MIGDRAETLNVAELQKEAIRRRLDDPKYRDQFFTYSKEYMSLAMCRVNEPPARSGYSPATPSATTP